MSDNMSYSDCVEAIIPPILEICSQTDSDGAAKIANMIKETLTEWKGFLKEFVKEDED